MTTRYEEQLTEYVALARRRLDLFSDDEKKRLASSLKMQDYGEELERRFQQQKPVPLSARPS